MQTARDDRWETEVRRVLAEALPAGWSLEHVAPVAGGLLVRGRDARGVEHTLQLDRPAPGRQAFVSGSVLLGSYWPPAGAQTAEDNASRRDALERLIGAEARLEPWIGRAPAGRTGERARRPGSVYLAEAPFLARTAAQLAVRRSGVREAAMVAFDAMADPEVGDLEIYLEARCVQRCEFCDYALDFGRPVRRALNVLTDAQQFVRLDLVGSGAFEGVIAACARRTPPIIVAVSGFDWARHPHVDAILDALERHPTVPIRLVGPSTRMADRAFARRVAALPGLDAVCVTLQSVDPATHDAIVGAPGSGEQILAAIENLREFGANTTVAVVLTERTMPTLGQTIRWIQERDLPYALRGFVPDRRPDWEPGPMIPRADVVRAALEAAGPIVSRRTAVWGLPLCALPPAFRPHATPNGLTQMREPAEYPAPCGACSARSACVGVPASYARRYGAAGLRAIE